MSGYSARVMGGVLLVMAAASEAPAWVNGGFESGSTAGWASTLTFGPNAAYQPQVLTVTPGAAPHTQGTLCPAPAVCLDQVHSGGYAVELGSGRGDANHGDWAQVSQTDTVPSGGACLTFYLAAVLSGHHFLNGESYGSDAYVQADMLIAGSVVASQRYSWFDNANLLVDDGADPYGGPQPVVGGGPDAWKHLPWTQFYFDLSAYAGQAVTLRFTAYSCDASGHNSLAFVDDVAWGSCPSPTPSPSATASASPSTTRTLTARPSATATATPSATPTVTSTYSVTPTASVTRTAPPSASESATATATPTATSTRTATPSATGSATLTGTRTATGSSTATPSATPTVTPSSTPSVTGTFSASPTATPSATPTASPSATTTATPTPTATGTPSLTATRTATPTSSPSPTVTPTFTGTPTATPSPTATGTFTRTATFTDSPTASPSPTITQTCTPGPNAYVSLSVYNSAGELVKVLAYHLGVYASVTGLQNAASFAAGGGGSLAITILGAGVQLAWDGTNAGGQRVAGGVYTLAAGWSDPYGKVTTLASAVSLVPIDDHLELAVFNAAGERVRHAWQPWAADATCFSLSARVLSPGAALTVSWAGGSWAWDGFNDLGAPVASGSYLIQLLRWQAGSSVVACGAGIIVLNAPAAAGLASVKAAPDPMPVGGHLGLQWQPWGQERLALTLYAVDGARVRCWSTASAAGQCQLDLADLAPGLYVLELTVGGEARVLERRRMKLAIR